MPFYKYIEIHADGSEGSTFEVLQSIHDEPLQASPGHRLASPAGPRRPHDSQTLRWA